MCPLISPLIYCPVEMTELCSHRSFGSISLFGDFDPMVQKLSVPLKVLSVLLFTLTGLAPTSAIFARDRTVFMQETDGQKQIVLSENDGSPLRALTSGVDLHMYPDISADGKWVVYAEGPANDPTHPNWFKIVVQNIATGARRDLTALAPMTLHPSLSGNVRRLAYSSQTEVPGVAGQKRAQIFYVDLALASDGLPQVVGIPKKIESANEGYFPTLTSDGSAIYYHESLATQKRRIAKTDFLDGSTTYLTADDGNSMAPSLSADDRLLAYTSKDGDNWDVYVRDLGAGTVTRVTDHPGNDFAPTFAADGSLIFASDRAGSFQIYKIPAGLLAARAEPTLFASGSGDLYRPAISGEMTIGQGRTTSMLDPGRSSFGATRVGSKVFVAGGHQGHEHTYPPESFLNVMEYFDQADGQWHRTAPRAYAAHGFGMAATDKYVFAFGGFAYDANNSPKWKSLDIIERYDIEQDRWEVVGTLPRRRSSNVVAQIGTKVWLIGGWDSTPHFNGDYDGTFHREIDIFDMETLTITTSSIQLPDPLRRALTAVVVGPSIYLIGGISEGASHFHLIDNVTVLDTTTGTWTNDIPLPFATFAPAAGFQNGKLLILGGMYKLGEFDYVYVNHVFARDLSHQELGWQHTGRYLHESKGFSQVVDLQGGGLGILGGHHYNDGGDDAPVATFEWLRW